MIGELIHFLTGTVSIKAEGGFAERFVNLCTAEGIPLWNIKKVNSILYADTTPHGYKKIRKPAKSGGMKITILKKKGIPFIINKYKNRIGLGIGLLVFAVGLIALSGRVWIIEVNGNSTVSSAKILQAFDESGLTYGKKISALDPTQIKVNANLKIPEISWVNINTRGCRVVIEVRETQPKPDITIKGGVSNIIARKDGQIEIIEPYRGTPAKKWGQTVLKGNLLISGTTQSRMDTTIFSQAEGYVVARTKIGVETVTPLNEEILESKTVKIYSFYFFGKSISLPHKKDADIIYTTHKRASINGTVLPIGIDRTEYTFTQTKKETANRDIALLTALNDYAIESYNKTLHSQIISKDVKINKQNSIITVTGDYDCYENIGEQSDLQIEENITE